MSKEHPDETIRNILQGHPKEPRPDQPRINQTVVASLPPRLHHSSIGRLVVVDTVYHQPFEGPASEVSSRFNRFLSSDEQPYRRTPRIDSNPVPIESGWIPVDKVGMVFIENLSPRPNRPLDETDHSNTVYVSMEDHALGMFCMVIPPGESARFQPYDISKLRLRAGNEVKVSYVVYPS